ncbi:MAG: flavodoxin [Firmicutes bacterium]|nr:flavodoxin [Bacillota bacterium]
MSRVAVVYWSGTGNTEAMANAVLEGAKEAGAEAVLFTSAEFSESMVGSYDAIAFGCPAMGAEELEEDEFAPMYEACKGSLSGKKIALFGSYGWGDGEWMRSWEASATGAGALLAAGSVICNDAPDDEGVTSCKALGASLASA